MNQRLYRSRDDRIAFGVAGGLADQFNIDPSLIRILWVILTILTGGAAFLLYIAMAFIVPEEPAGDSRWAGRQQSHGGYQWPEGGASAAIADAPPVGPTATGPTLASTDAGPNPGTTASGPAAARSSSAPAFGTGSAPGTPAAWAAQQARAAAADARAGAREARQQARAQRREAGVEGRGALILGLLLMLVGGYFLVRAYVPAVDVDRAWPILIVVVGVVFVLGSVRRSAGPSA